MAPNSQDQFMQFVQSVIAAGQSGGGASTSYFNSQFAELEGSNVYLGEAPKFWGMGSGGVSAKGKGGFGSIFGGGKGGVGSAVNKGTQQYSPTQPIIKSGVAVMQDIFKLPPSARMAVKQKMYDAGIYDGNPNSPDLDPAFLRAFTGLAGQAALRFSQGEKITPMQILDEMIAGGGRAALGGAAAKVPPLELSNPEDLKGALRQASIQTIGRAVGPDELEKWVGIVHAYEQEKYNAQLAGAGGTLENAPPGSAAGLMEMVRKDHPEEAFATDYADQATEFYRLLGGAR